MTFSFLMSYLTEIILSQSMSSHGMPNSRPKVRFGDFQLACRVTLTISFLVTVFDNTQSGAAVANDVLLHSTADGLPFGGTGLSGRECLVFQGSASINELSGIQMDITLESTVLIRLLTPGLLLILPHCMFDIFFFFFLAANLRVSIDKVMGYRFPPYSVSFMPPCSLKNAHVCRFFCRTRNSGT
jgi:hypothetical protein